MFEFVQEPGRGRAPAHDQDPPAGEVLGGPVLGRGDLQPGEVGGSGHVGAEGAGPGSGGIDQDGGAHGPVVGLQHELVVLPAVDPVDVHGAAYPQVEVALVAVVVLAHDVAGGPGGVGGVEAEAEFAHAGQVVDLVHEVQAQRLPPELPRAAGVGPAVEHEQIGAGGHPEAAQVPGGGEPGLARPDHDDVDGLRQGCPGGFGGCGRGDAHVLSLTGVDGVNNMRGGLFPGTSPT